MREQTVAMYCFPDDLLTLTLPRQARDKWPPTPVQRFLIQCFRKGIETASSQ